MKEEKGNGVTRRKEKKKQMKRVNPKKVKVKCMNENSPQESNRRLAPLSNVRFAFQLARI